MLTIKTISSYWLETANSNIKNFLVMAVKPDPLTNATAQKIMIDTVIAILMLSLPIMVTVFFAAIIASLLQGGLLFVPNALTPKWERINPISNAKRIFSSQSIIEMVKNLLELIILLSACYKILFMAILNAPNLVGLSANIILPTLAQLTYQIILQTIIVLFAFALLDYGYQWYKHEKSLRMSKQEIKDEFRHQEGDPLVKGQRRRVARELVQKRSLRDVINADVIITNPTHFAVALQYDRETLAAPIVVAKGTDLIAKKIREIATQHDIAIVEEPPLARALYKEVEIGQTIPTEFFRAVAEILAYVYQRKEKYFS